MKSKQIKIHTAVKQAGNKKKLKQPANQVWKLVFAAKSDTFMKMFLNVNSPCAVCDVEWTPLNKIQG